MNQHQATKACPVSQHEECLALRNRAGIHTPPPPYMCPWSVQCAWHVDAVQLHGRPRESLPLRQLKKNVNKKVCNVPCGKEEFSYFFPL